MTQFDKTDPTTLLATIKDQPRLALEIQEHDTRPLYITTYDDALYLTTSTSTVRPIADLGITESQLVEYLTYRQITVLPIMKAPVSWLLDVTPRSRRQLPAARDC